MNKLLIQQIGSFSPRKTGWHNHVSNCIAVEMCPECGSDIFFNEEVLNKELGKTTFFACSTCELRNYDYAEYRL